MCGFLQIISHVSAKATIKKPYHRTNRRQTFVLQQRGPDSLWEAAAVLHMICTGLYDQYGYGIIRVRPVRRVSFRMGKMSRRRRRVLAGITEV